MIRTFAKAWEQNKDYLMEYLRDNKQTKYASYEELVRQLFNRVINPYIDDNGDGLFNSRCTFVTDEILTIDDGSYEGTQIFILHKDTYNPSTCDYVYTSVDYGSCSGCDTLLRICGDWCSEELPSEAQLNDYMYLCLHLLQRCKRMTDDDEECEE